jgi:lipopolysaccharide export LptBFGC system permease protein LptF
MWKLHRYYLKEVLISSAITFLVLFAVVLVSVVYRGIDRVQGGGPFALVLFVLFWALDSFQHLLTVSFLLATVMTFTRAAQDRELIAIRAAGISPFAPMTSAVLVGMLLTVLGSFALHYVIPEVHFAKYRVVSEMLRNLRITLKVGSDRLMLPGGHVMIYGQQGGGEYRDCTIYSRKPPARLQSPIWFVDRVVLPELKDNFDEMPEFEVQLYGIRDPIAPSNIPGPVTIAMPFADVISGERRDDRDDDLRSDQLLSEVLRGVHRAPTAALYTLFRRCCFSLMPLLLAPIGYCLAELARERGRVAALALSLVPLSLFYVGEVLGARLLLATDWPLSGCLPAVLLALFGLPLCWRQLRR